MKKKFSSGASLARNVEMPCVYCGKIVYVRSHNQRAVCANWPCQREEIHHRAARERKWEENKYARRKRPDDTAAKGGR
jgi:predicted RNA-binding Zn-ribbon protein involved in translation (DUF1610 family)